MGNTEQELEKPIKKSIKINKKIVIGIIISLCSLIALYLGMAIYFINHFYFGTEINSIDVSGKTLEEVNTLMAAKLDTYTLKIKERGNKNEEIKAAEVGLKYNTEAEFKNLKDRQKPFKWILEGLSSEDFKISVEVSYNESLLKGRIDKLACFDISNIIEPKNASLKFTDKSYIIVEEVAGNKVNKDILYSNAAEAIVKKDTSLDLEAIDAYIKPQYTSKWPKLIETKDIFNKYAASNITYTFGERKENLDCSTINTWLTVDDNFTVTLDEQKVKDYIEMLSKTYNTVGKVRSFAASSGKTVNVGGGDYGWAINIAKETQNLITDIKEGKTVTKEPIYSQTAILRGSNDIGKTYVEIDLTKQHLWFYKNGALIVQGDVVTGNVSAGNATPKGIYRLKYKQKDAVLRGPDYAAPVTFWMPFNGGIGIHDASWRTVFGGKIYTTSGSHGCINSPYNVAKAIFYNIEAGTPVVCY